MKSAEFSLWRLIAILCALFMWQGIVFGQKPVKCRLENKNDPSPSYRMGWTTYSIKGPKVLFLAVGISPRHFSRDDMVALARRIKQDFCQEQRLNVSFFDNPQAARDFFPTSETEWFQKHWRGTYLLDRCSGMESINFSTAPNNPRDEVKINLGEVSPP